jgi:hypothetical protein
MNITKTRVRILQNQIFNEKQFIDRILPNFSLHCASLHTF